MRDVSDRWYDEATNNDLIWNIINDPSFEIKWEKGKSFIYLVSLTSHSSINNDFWSLNVDHEYQTFIWVKKNLVLESQGKCLFFHQFSKLKCKWQTKIKIFTQNFSAHSSLFSLHVRNVTQISFKYLRLDLYLYERRITFHSFCYFFIINTKTLRARSHAAVMLE